MFNFKILIVRDKQFLIKEFEVHNTDENTVKIIIESYIKINFNDDCEGFYFFTV